MFELQGHSGPSGRAAWSRVAHIRATLRLIAAPGSSARSRTVLVAVEAIASSPTCWSGVSQVAPGSTHGTTARTPIIPTSTPVPSSASSVPAQLVTRRADGVPLTVTLC